ncbi:MAG TPA: HEAT repeat domain-containing protein [Pyrinomonadaceae bacterium]|jgi:HEAT repeat protein|nr:HEAT repeat domain-containing protein [Pyrinomonadaceae bacterium]
MKNELTRHDIAVRKDARQQRDARVSAWTASRCVRLGLVGSLGASLALMMNDHAPRAQQRYTEPTVKVTSVTTSGNVVSISADGSLGRAQTWQDPEGFHVVLVNGQASGGVGGGVKTRKVGNSLELVVPVRRGASVTVEPRGNRLDLVLSGGQGGALNVENFPVEQKEEAQTRTRARESSERESAPREQEEFYAPQPTPRRRNEAAQPSSQQSPAPQQPAPNVAPAQTQTAAPHEMLAPAAGQTDAQALPQHENAGGLPAHETTAASGAPAQLETGKGFSFLSFLTSASALFVLAGALLAGALLVFLRRRRDGSDTLESSSSSKRRAADGVTQKDEAEAAAKPFRHTVGDRRKSSVTVPFERRRSGRGSEDSALRQQIDTEGNNFEGGERALELRAAPLAASPAVEFGAYRIDQEVAALVAGKPHTLEVIASRAADDRRAVETSLLKALRSHDTDADGRRRARTALEDYGFVARSCASLLLGSESFERASAARALGEMRSPQALPFLTEALYDPDSVVRNECVQSLGTLGLPSAIGALLDVARRHPDLSANVLGPALTACSVESLELSWNSPSDSRTFAESHDVDDFSSETVAIMPAESYEELPEFVEDATLASALERAGSEYPESRVVAAQNLAQFQVRRAVEALGALARDSDPAVRSAAVTSLGLINHESVFVHVICALADEAREVRAAAARAMSRLSFDRADAYVRVIESADDAALREVAQAAIKAGLAAQAISRLNSEDRRQAYEAFSLLTLCAKAGEVQPILDTVECHRDIEVRLTCIRLLGLSMRPELGEQLARIAGNGGVPERVRRAIIETMGSAAKHEPAEVHEPRAESQTESEVVPVGME